MTPTTEAAEKPIRRVLLVDDDATDNYLHKRIIEKSGLVQEIVVFEQPELALQYLSTAAQSIDIICLDINMPRMNGYEFLKAFHALEISKSCPPVIVILSTSITAESIESEKNYSSVVATELKPLRLETLRQLVRTCFGCRGEDKDQWN